MDLAKRFAAGDLDAFEVLFREHQRHVYRWIVRIVRDTAAAEDLTVEAFWRMYRARARFNPEGNCGAWLRRIATNVALDHLRHAKRQVPLPEDLPADPAPDSAVQRETRLAIRSALAGLSPRLRVVVQLGLVEDEPYDEIALALGISPNAVKVRMFRAVRLLRKKLLEAGITP
jgi:RNA polymerase sigma-70 factor (ECF subfamily)